MSSVKWDQKAREFLRKLPKEISKRIFNKVDKEIKNDVERYLEKLVDKEGYKIRVGNYRLFVDFFKDKEVLIVRAIRHRKNAYKKK